MHRNHLQPSSQLPLSKDFRLMDMLTSILVPAARIRRPWRTCTRATASGRRSRRCGGRAVCDFSGTIIIIFVVVVVVVVVSEDKSGARHTQRGCRSESETRDGRQVLRLRGRRPRHFVGGGGNRTSHRRRRSRSECGVSHKCGRRIESCTSSSIRSIGWREPEAQVDEPVSQIKINK